MQLKLTFKDKDQREIDLMVDEDQKISETIQVLAERELWDGEQADSIQYIKSLRSNKQVNILLTYREAKIYSGDILVPERAEM